MARIVEASTPLGAFLTPEQKRFFKKNGIIHFPGFFSRDTVVAFGMHLRKCKSVGSRKAAKW